MRDGIIALIVGMVLVMSGFNSVVLLIAMDNSTEPITVTVDLTGLEPGLNHGLITELEGLQEDVQHIDESQIEEAAHEEASQIQIPVLHRLSPLFSTNSYFVVGDKAYCTDVLGTAKISYGLASGTEENPEGRTDSVLTELEHDTGNLIIVGGPAVNPIATEFGRYFRITYENHPDVSFKINAENESIFLDLTEYPKEDICLVYLGHHKGRNVLMVWGYGWEGTYAGSVFAADPRTWEKYEGAHLFMLRWNDLNRDGLVQKSEITVEDYL
jgi:hypothetical protein